MVSHIIIKDQAIRAQPGGLPFFSSLPRRRFYEGRTDHPSSMCGSRIVVMAYCSRVEIEKSLSLSTALAFDFHAFV